MDDSRISRLDKGETGRRVEACKQVKSLSTFVVFVRKESYSLRDACAKCTKGAKKCADRRGTPSRTCV